MTDTVGRVLDLTRRNTQRLRDFRPVVVDERIEVSFHDGVGRIVLLPSLTELNQDRFTNVARANTWGIEALDDDEHPLGLDRLIGPKDDFDFLELRTPFLFIFNFLSAGHDAWSHLVEPGVHALGGFLGSAHEHTRVIDVSDELLAEAQLTLRNGKVPKLLV